MMCDSEMLFDTYLNDLAFLTNNWKNCLGRPLVTMIMSSSLLEGNFGVFNLR